MSGDIDTSITKTKFSIMHIICRSTEAMEGAELQSEDEGHAEFIQHYIR